MPNKAERCTMYCTQLFTILFSIILLLSAAPNAFAECKNDLPLKGKIRINKCDASKEQCADAKEAVFKYASAKKFAADVYSISLHGNPWRLYDGNWRILNVEDLATFIKSQRPSAIKRIILDSSWSGVPPLGNSKSLAQKLSAQLDGFPVEGMDGFVWYSKDGTVRTTQQAFTMTQIRYPYMIAPGEDVMVSLVAGWPIDYEEDYIKKQDAYGLFRVAVGWDIFMLCPDKALEKFEAAAKLAHPIAAYNAAVMRLERGKKGDKEAAITLLSMAAELGDKPSQKLLDNLKSNK